MWRGRTVKVLSEVSDTRPGRSDLGRGCVIPRGVNRGYFCVESAEIGPRLREIWQAREGRCWMRQFGRVFLTVWIHFSAQAAPAVLAATPAAEGQEVVVVYNRKVEESRLVAEEYARRRFVPTNQVIGLDVPTAEVLTRAEYLDQIQEPLVDFLSKERLWVVQPPDGVDKVPATNEVASAVRSSRVRYLALCYGVPIRIAEDAAVREPGLEHFRAELRRNEAAVDSELACLPLQLARRTWTGPRRNPVYAATNRWSMHPTNGVLVVARLDGPTPAIARGLVDKSLKAEADGLWGRAYFDLRGLTNGTYKLGDDWIGAASEISRRLGFETIVDRKPETFGPGFPLSQIGFYFGWYETDVSGPFTRDGVEFMPGALAYHLHSFSAAMVRTETRHWVGPLLAKGATATLGCVAEPYLEATPDLAVLLGRFLFHGLSFGEAALAAQGVLSWQTTVLGDPLYRPFRLSAQARHEALEAQQNPRIEWSHLRVVNLNLASGTPPSELIDYLRAIPLTKQSAVLSEKLGDLCFDVGRFEESIEHHGRVLTLQPTLLQRTRVILNLARTLALYQRKDEALGLYQEFLKREPDYPDRNTVLRKMVSVARDLGREEDANRWQQEIDAAVKPAN